ncbi:putative acetyltransferase [Litorimonas taeanensis]|uniref:Putative acetyltransferase n=1 Tax=Litorimonas taeanensis TaxID=568099 RepID=A0A420WFT1_9PROT|nr:GNAT family N-acetyltransferase [Litorimonas taeanensis]RKQ69815.1 putative acetyltransferase [Litorimonas taeanensis]
MLDVLTFDIADLDAEDVRALLRLHLLEAYADACTAALNIEALREEDVTLYSARTSKQDLAGIAGLKILTTPNGTRKHGEIKSVRTHTDFLRQGVSSKLMGHLEQSARLRGLDRLFLQTHPTPAYAAACRLYEKLGYEYCSAFGDYKTSPKSVFMTKAL